MKSFEDECEGLSELPEIPELPGSPELQEAAAQKKMKSKLKSKKKRAQLTINLTGCKYDSVRRVARRFGMKTVGDDEDWSIFWTDTSIMLERVTDMRRYQKVNHFPGMIDICRKDQLARSMNRMKKLFPKEYNVFPASWCLPADFGEFQTFTRSKKNKTFISKPESGCQGKGIFVFKNYKEIKDDEHCVVQQYISKPFILDGFKFDLRIYVLVTSCDPLRIFVYHDGLGRFATVKYHEPQGGNLGEQCMHLTNYAINKTSKDFVRDDDVGSKRKITAVNKWFVDNGYDIKKIWDDIDDVIIKTLIAAHPKLKHNYRTCFPHHNKGSACFEILGFDVLLDRKLKPWLIEVNHSPSFHTDAPLDKEVKEGLLYDTFNLIDLYANDKRKCIEEDKRKVKERLLLKQRPKEESQNAEEKIRTNYMAHLEKYELSHAGGFRRIYPRENEELYAKFFDQGASLCAETASSKARSELSKLLREEIEAKQKEMDSYRKKFSGGKPGTTSGKSDEVRPESPSFGEKKAKMIYSRRGGYFCVPVPLYSSHTAKSHKRSDTKRVECSRVENPETLDLTEVPRLVPPHVEPHVDLATPQEIREEEEIERLASMKLRDNLIKKMGIFEQVQASLDKGMNHKNNSSVPSSHCSYPLRINEHGYATKIQTQTSRITTAGVHHIPSLSANLHTHRQCIYPQQQPPSHTDQYCHYPGIHRANSTLIGPDQHSSIMINDDTATAISTMRPTPPHYLPLPKQYSNHHRTHPTLKMPVYGLKSCIWNKQQGSSPIQSWGTAHKRYKLPGSRSVYGSIGTPAHQKQVDLPMNTTNSDLVAIGLSVSSAPIHLFYRDTSHPPTCEDWIHSDAISEMQSRQRNGHANPKKSLSVVKRLESLLK